MIAYAKARTVNSCISTTDALGPALRQQVGGEQGGLVAALTPNTHDELLSTRVGERIESARQRGRSGLGVVPRGRDAFVTQEVLQVRDVPPACEQPGPTVCRNRCG